ncbi:MAG: hypothetical protein RL226_529 [Bacteroidota bacterium]|jgi:hypothetical protein
MDYQFEMEWLAVQRRIAAQFGEDIDLQGILYIIGVQELGQGFRSFKKDEKVDLMHIAICKLLEPYGYYRYDGIDKDGWPHYERLTQLPHLEAGEQERLIKRAIIAYFKDMGEIA